LALFIFLVYFATENQFYLNDNHYQKLAVVSDPPRSLVYKPTPNYYWSGLFFCMEKQYAPTPVLFVWFTWRNRSWIPD